MKQKSINNKVRRLFSLSLLGSFIFSVNVYADGSFMKRYTRENYFKPLEEKQQKYDFMPDALKPHEIKPTFSNLEDLLESLQANEYAPLHLEMENILNGAPLYVPANPDLWYLLRGGELTGNGGGIVEAKFDYHFDRLPKYINDCLNSINGCRMNENDKEHLKQIRDIMISKKDDHNRLIFKSGEEHPKFFTEGETIWGVRTAKTGFSPEIPIFINTDHLYHNNLPAMDDGEIISLLVHETGHQAKNKDHAYLNRLGSELAYFLNGNSFQMHRHHQGHNHQVQITNFEESRVDAEATLTYANEQIDLKPMIKDSLSCWHPDQRVVGFELSNPHWQREKSEEDRERFPMGVWAKVHCQNPMQRIVFKRDMDMVLHFMFSKGSKRVLEEVQVEIPQK